MQFLALGLHVKHRLGLELTAPKESRILLPLEISLPLHALTSVSLPLSRLYLFVTKRTGAQQSFTQNTQALTVLRQSSIDAQL